MIDLISRQMAIDAMRELPYGYRGIVWGILNSLPSAPPTIDAVEVVHCKDCVHWKDEGFDSAGKCELWNIVFEYDWFCADGEREEQADERM